MSPSSHLLAGLLSIQPAARREQASHVVITEDGHAAVHARDGQPLGGGSLPLDDLDAQIQTLAQSGLFGGVSIEQSEQGRVVKLHSGSEEERQQWLRRMTHAEDLDLGERMLAAAAQLRVTQWRRDQAMLEVQRQVWAAADAGVAKTIIADLVGVARKTVYEILNSERPEPLDEPAPTPPAAAAVAADEPATAPSPHAGARDAVTAADLIRLPVGRKVPCVMCGTDTNHVTPISEEGLHTGACLGFYNEGRPTREPRPAPAPNEPATAAPPSRESTPSTQAPRPQPVATQAASTTRPKRNGAHRESRPATTSRSRFAAAVAAWDGNLLYMPGGAVHEFTAPSHLGEVASLVSTYRLGHGGGAALPDRGEIWLYPAALETLGLPLEVNLPTTGSAKERREARRAAFDALSHLGVIERARDDGWILDNDRVEARTRMRHPDLLPGGAHLVMIPWSETTGMPLLVEGTETPEQMSSVVSPAVLVDRLQEFADLIGVTWRVSAAETGVDLVDVTRPPLRPGDEPGTRIALTRGEIPDLPEFLNPRVRRGDARFSSDVERVFSWWRPWESLLEQEKSCRYVMAFDHTGHFLGPYTSTMLGVRGVQQLTGEAARWDGTERPGYWAVTRWQTPSWMFPDPALASGPAIDEDKVLVTAHTLKQLDMIVPGFSSSLTYHWAWVWQENTRYLEPTGERLKKARREGSEPVAATVKQVYAHMTQKLASLDSPPPQLHLRRPDWRDHLVAAARSALLRTVVTIQQTSGAIPLVVDRDTIIYAVDTDDPAQAWPGDPAKYGWSQGQWKPDSIALLKEWGPSALPPRKPDSRARWDYSHVTKHMTKIRTERS